MTTVADILRAKGSAAIYSVTPSDTMLTALQCMAEKGVGALVVLQGQELVGIVTERDYARKIALQGRSSAATLISEVMTRQVQCVQPQHSSEACMALMTAQRVRHLPVVDGQRRLLGLISIGDIVKEIINAQQITIQQLEEFITGMPQPQV